MYPTTITTNPIIPCTKSILISTSCITDTGIAITLAIINPNTPK